MVVREKERIHIYSTFEQYILGFLLQNELFTYL